jgi:hypothetical protein
MTSTHVREVLLPVSGRVMVVHSGRDLEDNHHISEEAPAQYFAYDLLGLDEDMRLFRGGGTTLEQWAGFGMDVVAPEDGFVEVAKDGEADLEPRQEPARTHGN